MDKFCIYTILYDHDNLFEYERIINQILVPFIKKLNTTITNSNLSNGCAYYYIIRLRRHCDDILYFLHFMFGFETSQWKISVV